MSTFREREIKHIQSFLMPPKDYDKISPTELLKIISRVNENDVIVNVLDGIKRHSNNESSKGVLVKYDVELKDIMRIYSDGSHCFYHLLTNFRDVETGEKVSEIKTNHGKVFNIKDGIWNSTPLVHQETGYLLGNYLVDAYLLEPKLLNYHKETFHYIID